MPLVVCHRVLCLINDCERLLDALANLDFYVYVIEGIFNINASSSLSKQCELQGIYEKKSEQIYFK